jgi:tetratricopeptide (TPR) repeat protein
MNNLPPAGVRRTLNSSVNDDDSNHSEVSSHDEFEVAGEAARKSEISSHRRQGVSVDRIPANLMTGNISEVDDSENSNAQSDGVVHSGDVEIQHDYFDWDVVHGPPEEVPESDHQEIIIAASRPKSSPARMPLPRKRSSHLADKKSNFFDETSIIDCDNRSTSDSGSSFLGREGALAELGLTTIDIAELLLNRGTKSLLTGRFSDVFHNFNRAYKLLFESDGDVADSPEFDSSIKSQLNGLTRLSLLADIEKMYKLLTIDVCKEEARVMFESENFVGAIKKYDEVLILVPLHGECLSSRASCMLAAHDPKSCIDDCNLAIRILNAPVRKGSGNYQNDGIDIARCVAVSPSERKAWMVRTLQLRGTAHSQLNHLDKAVADFRLAVTLDPKNEKLRFGLRKSIVLTQLETTKGLASFPESHFNVDGSIRIQDHGVPVTRGCFWSVFRPPTPRIENATSRL